MAMTFLLGDCSMDLSNEQKEKILDVVDNSDAFMKEVLGYLERSNAKLDREEAYYKVKDSIYRFLLNDGEIWSNLKLTSRGGEALSMEDVNIETINNLYYETTDFVEGK